MSIDNEIRRIADEYAANLKARVDQRVEEMEADDNSHYLIYRVLGVTDEEGKLMMFIKTKVDFFTSTRDHL